MWLQQLRKRIILRSFCTGGYMLNDSRFHVQRRSPCE